MNSVTRENIRIAFRALRTSWLRTILSLMGMAIGIMSIVIIMSAGDSLKKVFYNQLDSFGTNVITIERQVPSSKSQAGSAVGVAQGISVTTLSYRDKSEIDRLSNISGSYATVLGQAIATSNNNEKQINYWAATYEFSTIDKGEIAEGRFYTSDEEEGLAKYVVLGSELAHQLFPSQDPLGQSIKLKKVNFTVIGVYKERGSTGFLSLDQFAFIPLKTAQKLLLGFDHLSFIIGQMHDTKLEAITKEDITALLRENHKIDNPTKDDFSVTTQEESQGLINTILGGITLVLAIIAGIALVVGGVGIMNIMYVAVNERVFEIGLRKSLGAPRASIKTQFLVEAILITFLGAVVGIAAALAVTYLIYIIANVNGFSWPFAVSLNSILLSIGFSSLVGISFGYFPAKKASELNPSEALNRSVM